MVVPESRRPIRPYRQAEVMAEGPDQTAEIGLEVDEADTWDFAIVFSIPRADDDPIPVSDAINITEALKYHPVDNSANQNPGYFTRLLTGNVFSSGCYSIIKSITGGAQQIGQKVIQAYYQDSSTVILPSSITETCQLILNTVRKYNGNHDDSNILVQEKWLDETEYLFKNKVLTVGVFGRHKAGKSSLLNALLHHEVLSVADTNETAFILRIYHKPSNHHGSSCFEDTEQLLSMKGEEIKGRRKIRKEIQKRNADIRGNAKAIGIDEVVAHVPFLCRSSTGDINIVLLDTPGLSESNEIGISGASEHQLMTCSVYVYVISCKQLEDSIDTDSLKAIVERDPNAFEERRILIAVTRLDLYNTPSKDDSDSDSDSDDESSPGNDVQEIPKRIERIKEVIQRQCKCLKVPIPDDCIIPLCATGALEARKKIIAVKNKKPIQESKLSTAIERDKISQLPLLEEKLSKIASNSHYLWHYNIVRDCTRYCDQAMIKLDGTKEGFMKAEKSFEDKVKEKVDIMKEFGAILDNLKSRYTRGSEFFRQLEAAYDEDLTTNLKKIDEVSSKHLDVFKDFQSRIKLMRKVTIAKFDSEVEKLTKEDDESLKEDLKDLPFRKIDSVVQESLYNLGSFKQELKQCLASYCNTKTSISVESHLPKDSIISESISGSGMQVSIRQPLKLNDVLHQSKVHYGFWGSILHLLKKFLSLEDPEQRLRKEEINDLLMELEKHFEANCHEFFQKIKPKIIKSYVKQHKEIAEKHITDVIQHYSEQKKKMDTEVKEWRKQASFNKEMVQRHSELTDNLEAQKKHLASLAKKYHGISLFTKHLQDE